MKIGALMTFFLLFTSRSFAQGKLIFENEHVVSISFVDYTEKIQGDSCLLQYNDSCDHLWVLRRHVYNDSRVYNRSLKEMQSLLDEIGRNNVPTAEDLDINIYVMKKELNRRKILLKYNQLFLAPDKDESENILKRYQPVHVFNDWLQNSYPIIDSGLIVINTAHDFRGMKIIIKTDRKVVYFDMRDIEMFQPYLMRTSDKDCLKLFTNFNVNKHIKNIFKILNIGRNVPWVDEVIESYILFCAKDYRL